MTLTTQCGFSFAVHLCGKKVSKIEFVKAKKHICKCGKKPMKANCCKNKVIVFKKLDHQQKAFKINVNVAAIHFDLNKQELFDILPEKQNSIKIFSGFYHPPPSTLAVPIFVRNCNFII